MKRTKEKNPGSRNSKVDRQPKGGRIFLRSRFKPGNPLTVFWRDIISDDEGWFFPQRGGYDPELSLKQSHCVTSGFFIMEKEDTLFIARTWRLADGTLIGSGWGLCCEPTKQRKE